MNLKELRARLNVVASEMSTLAQKNERTEAEDETLDKLLAEFNDLGPQVERLTGIEAAAAKAREMGQSAGRVSGAEVYATDDAADDKDTGGRQYVRRMGPGETFAKSDAVKAYNERGVQGIRVPINAEKAGATYDGASPIERYTLIDSADLPGFMVPPMVVPGVKRPRDYALTARDVLMSGRTTADTIYFIRELVYTNAAAETAEATAFDVSQLESGGRKPESALTFEEASAPVKTIAHWIPITKQALADTAQLQSYVENRLLVGLERRFNSQVWNGTGAGATLTGILATTGVQEIDDTDFASSPPLHPGTERENFERVLRGITEVELTGDAVATFVAMNPRDLEKFRTVADDNGMYIAGSPFSAIGVPTIWSRPIANDRAIPEGHAIVGDGTMAAIWDREDAAIFIDTINDQFVRNMLTILAEMRAALTVFRPAAFADVTLAGWS